MKARKGYREFQFEIPATFAWTGPPVALFWDQSLVWGIICRETLQRCAIPFDLLSSADIAQGVLDHYRVLLVPGGWSSHKTRALGENGKVRIERFIGRGGSYLGFCGGAGLALSSASSLELVPLERAPLSERLPNASGEIWVRGIGTHPMWKDLPQELPVSIWWPSQFRWQPLPRSVCLATYAATGADFWVADLPVSDLEPYAFSWEEREKIYGINLNPGRLLGQPAMVEVSSGRGRLILSYPHLETPGDYWGNRLFSNVLFYLNRKASSHLDNGLKAHPVPAGPSGSPGPEALGRLRHIQEAVDELIEFGERHLLWKWHLPWLLRWQRGIRGLEYGTLAVAVRCLAEEAGKSAGEVAAGSHDPWLKPVMQIEENIETFCHLARCLLLEEKLAGQTGKLTKLGKVNDRVDIMRMELFGRKMNHGGLCRTIFDQLDRLLLAVLRLQESRPHQTLKRT